MLIFHHEAACRRRRPADTLDASHAIFVSCHFRAPFAAVIADVYFVCLWYAIIASRPPAPPEFARQSMPRRACRAFLRRITHHAITARMVRFVLIRRWYRAISLSRRAARKPDFYRACATPYSAACRHFPSAALKMPHVRDTFSISVPASASTPDYSIFRFFFFPLHFASPLSARFRAPLFVLPITPTLFWAHYWLIRRHYATPRLIVFTFSAAHPSPSRRFAIFAAMLWSRMRRLSIEAITFDADASDIFSFHSPRIRLFSLRAFSHYIA